MGGAIARGLAKSTFVNPDDITVSNRGKEKLETIQGEIASIHTTTDNAQVAAQADLIVLGLKPQMFDAVLPELSGVTAGKCVVSIAPGISTGFLRRALPGAAVIRVMPNTPLMVGAGATAVARAEEVPAPL